jgi:hypothetical protein
MNTTKMNAVVKTVAWLIAGALAVVMAALIGMIVLGAGKAHAGMSSPATASYAVVAQRGGHGHGGHA